MPDQQFAQPIAHPMQPALHYYPHAQAPWCTAATSLVVVLHVYVNLSLSVLNASTKDAANLSDELMPHEPVNPNNAPPHIHPDQPPLDTNAYPHPRHSHRQTQEDHQ